MTVEELIELLSQVPEDYTVETGLVVDGTDRDIEYLAWDDKKKRVSLN